MQKLVCSFLTMLAFASPIYALDSNDSNEIHQIIDHITDAWNHNQGHGFADFYAEDSDFVNIFGMVFCGKEEIEARHVAILETFLKNSIFEVINVRVREVNSDVAIAHVNWKVSNLSTPEKDIKEMNGVFTHVFLKTDGKWKITASQNTLKR